MATFAQDDDGVVVIIGSGAGGGTLANALAKQKIRSVVLEAGKRHTLEDIENDEWAMFKKISWLDKRQAAGGWHLKQSDPARLDRQGRRRQHRALGRHRPALS
jgi:choline dehydrogenase-like flavoprotein